EHPERIHKACLQKVLKARALLVREALAAAIRLRIRQIELGMRHVEVATEHDRFVLLELPDVGEKRRIPVPVAQRQTTQIVLGIWCVHRYYVEPLQLQRDHGPFLRAVALQFVSKLVAPGEVIRKTVDDRERSLLGEDGGSRIPFPDCGVPVLVVSRQVDLDLAALGLGFLQAEDFRLVRRAEWLEQTFFQYGANTVDVPGVQLHCRPADCARPARSRAAKSSSDSWSDTAATFSSRCATLEVPGIGSMTGLRRSI